MRYYDSQQAILTRLIAGTEQEAGATIYANCTDGCVTIDFDPTLTASENHCAAAKALCAWMNWHGRFIAAPLPDDQFCFVDLIDDQSGEIPDPAFVC